MLATQTEAPHETKDVKKVRISSFHVADFTSVWLLPLLVRQRESWLVIFKQYCHAKYPLDVQVVGDMGCSKRKTTTAQPVFNTPLIADAAEEMHHNPGAKLINRGFSLCLMVKLVLHRCSPTQDYRRSSGTDRKGNKGPDGPLCCCCAHFRGPALKD